MSALLTVKDLKVSFDTEDGVVHAVEGVSYEVEPGKTLGIVGESGSGKTVGTLTIMGLTRAANTQISGQAIFDGEDLLSASEQQMRAIRGDEIAMIFQDPLSSLHPFFTIGAQLVEAIQVHNKVSKAAARTRSAELLTMVGLSDARDRLSSYPHEFSGGMRQRVMIAMALANEPRLLIADEPTTALDVTVQAQILELIAELQAETGTAMIIITHDLGVVAEVADEIAVMYAGRIVEQASATELFANPQHPYTRGLLASIPRLDRDRSSGLDPIAGLPPSLIAPPSGCAFHPRCPRAFDRCPAELPPLEPAAAGSEHLVACLLSPEQRSVKQ
ncbi:MAG: ABC transporter ATP-binding protein [Solirubrobacterales bacterium]|nr:ABC transporter ATP-binding protein [Solirubrobacterales bacterium]